MLHGFALAICVIAALAVAVGAVWIVSGAAASARFSSAFGNAVQQYLAVERHSRDIRLGAASGQGPAQGWQLIERRLRARRAVRLAVR